MERVYKMGNKNFLKNISIFGLMFLLGIFGVTVEGNDPTMFYVGIFLIFISVWCLYIILRLKVKKMLEVTPDEVILFEKINIPWNKIEGFHMGEINIKSSTIQTIEINVKDIETLPGLSRWRKFGAIINKKTGFAEFIITSQYISGDIQELQQKLSALLRVSHECREKTLEVEK